VCVIFLDNDWRAPMAPLLTLISDGLGPRRGGAEWYLAQLAAGAAARGWPVCACVRRADPDFAAPGVRVLPLPAAWRHGVPGGAGTLLSTLPLPGVSHYQPHSGLYRDGFAAEREAFPPGLSRWAYPLGTLLNRRRQSQLRAQERLLRGRPLPRVMTFSRGVRERLLHHCGLPPEQVLYSPPGVDLELFHPGGPPVADPVQGLPAGGMTLLFVAHNFRLKGLPTLLQALARALAAGLDARLLVAGAGPVNGARRLAARLGVGDRVSLLGALSHARVADLYRRCDLLVHPTWSDHCCLAVLEALASGLPVITTVRDGASEWITPGRQGLVLAHPGDVAALTDALLLMADGPRRAAMGTAAAALRPRLDFAVHLQRVLAWLTDPSPGGEAGP
jgi:glycosyltransferase involved in cell wall biosynthesis